MKPRIAIPVPNSTQPLYVAVALPQYERAVRAAGGEPVVVEVHATPAEIAQTVKSCDGVLLPGSPADVDPEKYGEPRNPATAPADPARDNTDELLLQDAYNMRKPILAICYGMQSLNVWRTGTLDQQVPTIVNHKPGRTVARAHDVQVEPQSRLASILQQAGVLSAPSSTRIPVNSSHRQAVEVVGDGLRLVATSPKDSVKEAIEGTSPDHFVLGVQWHPERTYDAEASSRAIFAVFLKAAADWHSNLARTENQDFESVEKRG